MDQQTISKIKTITKLVVGHSVSATCAMAIDNIAHPATKRQKLELWVGAYVLGSMIADKSDDWVDKRIDFIVNVIEKVQAIRNGEPVTEEPQPTLDNE